MQSNETLHKTKRAAEVAGPNPFPELKRQCPILYFGCIYCNMCIPNDMLTEKDSWCTKGKVAKIPM